MAVRAAFEKLRGDDAAELYRMLWGYTDAQLRDEGAANQLVEYLGNESLDFRVLAIINLSSIMGKTLLYRPEAPERRRLQYIQRVERDPASTDSGPAQMLWPPHRRRPGTRSGPGAGRGNKGPRRASPTPSPPNLPRAAPARRAPIG